MIKLITTEDFEYQDILQLRNSVLRMPLGMDIRNDDLSDEPHCKFLAYIMNNGQMLGCLKIKKVDDKTYQIQQMAVLQESQKRGIGSILLKEAESLIKKQGGEQAVIEAREYAVPFYQKNGYHVSGEAFEKINLPHLPMRKSI